MKLSERFWNKRKGFTIVELVIVIAIIAILAAVLIPTFSNVIQRSKISADTQLCRNLNTVLTMATSEGRIPQSMYDVLYLISESGYLLANLNPTAEGYYFVWDQKGQQMVYVKDDLTTVLYPEDYKLDPSNCWVTVGDEEEAVKIATAGYNLYLEKTIKLLRLNDIAVSIDTGENKIETLEITGSSSSEKSVTLIGMFETAKVEIQNANYTIMGSVNTELNVGSNVNSVSIQGNISKLSGSITSAVNIGTSGYIGSVNGSGSISGANGSPISVNGNAPVSGAVVTTINGVETKVVSLGTKEAVDNIRKQIKGGRDFEGEVITLSNDINMSGIAFAPLSNYYRKDGTSNWFKGSFDGQGYTIKGFSTVGFSIAGLNAGTNDSTVPFSDGTRYPEATYGFLGTMYVPAGETVTIKNFNLEVNVNMTKDDAANYVGDSVGGILGYVKGAGTLNIENVTVSGNITSYDACGGFIGRAENDGSKLTINFKSCTNNAAVSAVRKCGGFVGSTNLNKVNYTFENCRNNGNITNFGVDYDRSLGAQDIDSGAIDGSGYYIAAPVIALMSGDFTKNVFSTTEVSGTSCLYGVANSGTVKIGDREVTLHDNLKYTIDSNGNQVWSKK